MVRWRIGAPQGEVALYRDIGGGTTIILYIFLQRIVRLWRNGRNSQYSGIYGFLCRGNSFQAGGKEQGWERGARIK
jgi:hypothetical protein